MSVQCACWKLCMRYSKSSENCFSVAKAAYHSVCMRMHESFFLSVDPFHISIYRTTPSYQPTYVRCACPFVHTDDVVFGKCSTHVRSDENYGIREKQKENVEKKKQKMPSLNMVVFFHSSSLSYSLSILSPNMLQAKDVCI